jgi:hypothetical protein
MIRKPFILLIGGTKRKIGKTTLAMMVIEKFGKANKIIGVKISNMILGDEAFHGFHHHKLNKHYSILKENQSGSKDSQRMLGSGAAQSFFIRVQDQYISEAYKALQNEIEDDAIVVCESNSLRSIVEPGLLLMVFDNNEKMNKPASEKLLELADVQFAAHDNTHFGETVNRIHLTEQGWFLLG